MPWPTLATPTISVTAAVRMKTTEGRAMTPEQEALRNQVLLSQLELLRACHSPEDTALAQARKVLEVMSEQCPHYPKKWPLPMERAGCYLCWADLKAALE